MFTIDGLDSNVRYEALVCYENITRPFLANDSGFIEQCGYCRTCFKTPPEGIVIIRIAI